MNAPRFTNSAFWPALAALAAFALPATGHAQQVFNPNNAPQLPQFNQFHHFNNPAFGNGLGQFNNGFLSPQASIFLQQRYNQHLANHYLYHHRYSMLNNPYFYFSPIVSQYGYYGNPWGTFPMSPYGYPFGYPYQFVPGSFGAYLQNNAINPFGFPVNDPFARQGAFQSGAGVGGLPNPQQPGQLDPANIFK